MKEESPKRAVLNQDEAFTAVRITPDLGRKQFMMTFLVAASLRINRGDFPASPLDMKFFAECASDLYDQREALARIFDGEDLRWWPGE